MTTATTTTQTNGYASGGFVAAGVAVAVVSERACRTQSDRRRIPAAVARHAPPPLSRGAGPFTGGAARAARTVPPLAPVLFLLPTAGPLRVRPK